MIARVLLLLCLCCACASINNPFRSLSVPGSPEAADKRVAKAEQELAAGKSEAALDDLRHARETEGLSTDQKNRIDVLLERCAEIRIGELSKPGSDPDDLKELFELNLPRQIAITAGVRAARMMLDQGEPEDAYSMLKKVDKRYPPAGTHHERVAAGDVLFEAGMQLSESNFSFLGFFSDKDDAEGILEYMVQNYPQERRCDQAYLRLAQLYEEQRLWKLAIERHQDLVTYHIDSPLAPASELRVPQLRMISLKRPDYDRRELLRALGELEAWLQVHAGSELEPVAKSNLSDCHKRLAESDLVVARFYTAVEQWDGARIHAERALALAKLSGDAPTIAKSEKALARVPSKPLVPEATPSLPIPAGEAPGSNASVPRGSTP